MSTTSLKIPTELKERAVAGAQQQGVSPHAFMVEAIAMAASMAEQRADFVASAVAARDKALKTNKAFDADDVHAYLKARILDKKTPKPKARSWQS